MITTDVVIQTADGPMDAFLAMPEKNGPVPALIVVQEAFGVNGHIKDICQRLAQVGFGALAPEFYHRSGRGVQLDYSDLKSIIPYLAPLTNEGLAMDLEASLGYLRSLPKVEPAKVGVIGFCMGGFTAYLAACRTDVAAAVCFYGAGIVEAREGIGFTPILQETENIRASVLMFFGQEDPSIPREQIDAIQKKLLALGKKHEINAYPSAGHGFFNDKRMSYRPEAAAAAWKRTLEWLGQYLSPKS